MIEISYAQFDRAIKRQFNKNIEEHGTSYTVATLENNLHGQIIETQPDRKNMIMKPDWKEFLAMIKPNASEMQKVAIAKSNLN